MGVLYDSVMEQKRQNLIQELRAAKVMVARNGQDIEELDYYELRRELSLAKIRGINIASESNIFF
ncbi:hypothetical protein [Bacillus sp. 1P02SD]|uniref:hypothetical protein n=1 Tax=Bacillus sp. 1P02SD TaxID=3132264 RepID=UPI0039A07D4F